jgi:hypothetical protein
VAVEGVRINVTSTATLIADGGGDGCNVAIVNGSTVIDLGGPDVETGEGFQLAAAGSISMDLPPGDVLYGVTASGTSAIQVLMTGR